MSLRPNNCVIALEQLCPVEDSGAPLGVNRAGSCASVNLVASRLMEGTPSGSLASSLSWSRDVEAIIDTTEGEGL